MLADDLVGVFWAIGGAVQVREIYETAIEAEEAYQLTDEDTKTLCLRCEPHRGTPAQGCRHAWVCLCVMEEATPSACCPTQATPPLPSTWHG